MSSAQQRLNAISPRTAWEPFTPTRRSRWDELKAAHLLRRAAFGASGPDVARAVQAGLEETLDQLFAPGSGSAAFDADADRLEEGAVASGDARQLEAAWMHRLLNSPFPLRERLTLFWHDHFATSQAKVDNLALMRDQVATLRRDALGNFPEMLHAMTRDPAMLIWLDSNTNRKGAANENYAREVFELFSLGLGNYSEQDIREAARALTGWSVRDARAHFDPAQHDDSEKTVFEQRGRFTSGDIVRLCLGRPACAMFLVRKLFQELVSDAGQPSEELLAPLAEGFRQRDFDIAWLVRRMLGSWLFYSDAAIQQRVKSPVELIVGTVKALEGRVGPVQAAASSAELGQRLYFPPSVKGWDGGRLWLNSSTLMRRQNLAFEVTRGIGESARCDPARLVREQGLRTADDMAGFFLRLFHQTADHPQRARIVEQLEVEAAAGPQHPFAQPARTARLARAAAHLALTLPEYQLG
ncbi:MAG: DUF1800 domain-containing protein [Planctomyces sp.]|nr:DUF1800 domain-containing protein [Planctomyces sp.]